MRTVKVKTFEEFKHALETDWGVVDSIAERMWEEFQRSTIDEFFARYSTLNRVLYTNVEKD